MLSIITCEQQNQALDIIELGKRNYWDMVEAAIKDPKYHDCVFKYFDKRDVEPIIIVAATQKRSEIVKSLISNRKVDINSRGIQNRTAFFCYINYHPEDQEMALWLLRNGANPKICEKARRTKGARYDEDNDSRETLISTSPLKRLFQLTLEGSTPDYWRRNNLQNKPRHYHQQNYSSTDAIHFVGKVNERREMIKLLLTYDKMQYDFNPVVRSETKLLKRYSTELGDVSISRSLNNCLNAEGMYILKDAKYALYHGNFDLLVNILEDLKITGSSSKERKFIALFVSSLIGSSILLSNGKSVPIMPIESCSKLVTLLTQSLNPQKCKKLCNFIFILYNHQRMILPVERVVYLRAFFECGAFLYQWCGWRQSVKRDISGFGSGSRKMQSQKVSLLQYAAQQGDIDLCEMLLDYVPDLKSYLMYKGTINRYAYQLADREDLRILLKGAFLDYCS